jgi:hypothetical protein
VSSSRSASVRFVRLRPRCGLDESASAITGFAAPGSALGAPPISPPYAPPISPPYPYGSSDEAGSGGARLLLRVREPVLLGAGAPPALASGGAGGCSDSGANAWSYGVPRCCCVCRCRWSWCCWSIWCWCSCCCC